MFIKVIRTNKAHVHMLKPTHTPPKPLPGETHSISSPDIVPTCHSSWPHRVPSGLSLLAGQRSSCCHRNYPWWTGIRPGDQESSVDSCCWHGLDVRVPGALSKKNQSWLSAAASVCNKTLLGDRSLDVIASCPVPFPPICQPASLHSPPVPKSSPHHEGGTRRPEVKPLSSTFRG